MSLGRPCILPLISSSSPLLFPTPLPHSSFRARRRLEVAAIVKKRNLCRMETCFDVEKCRAIPDYKVYVYPVQDRLSPSYAKILSSIRDSRFYTPDPKLACLFILAIGERLSVCALQKLMFCLCITASRVFMRGSVRHVFVRVKNSRLSACSYGTYVSVGTHR